MNIRNHLFLTALCLLCCANLFGQRIEILADSLDMSMRGLSVVNDRVLWVSGSKGSVGLSVDGGRKWAWHVVPGYAGRDFRDIEAFDDRTAVILAIAEPAVILRTTDGGNTWKVVYENKTAGMFLDAMDFSDDRHGTVVGDPMQGRFFIAHTHDGGATWKEAPAANLPKADSGEACFAASGTNLRLGNDGTSYLVSGGKRSRLFVNGNPQDLPLLQGKESTGANSFAYYTDKKSKTNLWIVTGGDFSNDTLRAGNCVLSRDLGKTWTAPTVFPTGYRSCVEFITPVDVLTCGTSGVDFSSDAGLTWKKISPAGFHVCRKAKKGAGVFLAGKGRIARYLP